jgi:hypothetical protein
MMTNPMAEVRRRNAAFAVALAAVAVIAAWLVIGMQGERLRDVKGGALAAPAFAAAAGEAQVIVVVGKDGGYRIAKGAKGWAMADRGEFPILRERLAAFTEALEKLTLERPLTRDPKKHARLGIDDPAKGGAGVAVQVQDLKGGLLADLIIGAAADGRTYVRRAGEDQVWAANVALPDLRRPSAWLDLTPLTLAPERIGRVDIAPAIGAGYGVVRVETETFNGFQLARPMTGKPISGNRQPDEVAAGLLQVKPIDVAPAPNIAGPPVARAVLRTFDGLVIDAELYRRGEEHWLKLGARGDNETASAEAAALNLKIGPWAYQLDPAQAETIAAPLEQPPPPPAATPAPTSPAPPSTAPAPG